MEEEFSIVLEGSESIQSFKKTSCQMTKYEYAALIIKRATQISEGECDPLIETDTFDPVEIAKQELHAGLIPFMIERVLPDESIERWKVSELIIADH